MLVRNTVSYQFGKRYVRYLKRLPPHAEKSGEDNTIAGSTTIGSPVEVSAPTIGNPRPGVNRRRRISPEAGHALEKLGHAIEYLTDELVHEGSFSANDARIQAVQLLMAVNRQIYFACPEVPALSYRFLSLLHL